KQYTGSVTIAPYGSVVLVKTSSEGAKEEAKPTPVATVELSLPTGAKSFAEGESLELKADVAANGAVISKVNFYYGLKLIGSSVKSPYQTVSNDIPRGSHYVWASAIDSKGKEIASKEIDIEILAAKTTAPSDDSNSVETGLPVTGMYFNT